MIIQKPLLYTYCQKYNHRKKKQSKRTFVRMNYVQYYLKRYSLIWDDREEHNLIDI